MALNLPSPAQVKPLFFSETLYSNTSTKLPGSFQLKRKDADNTSVKRRVHCYAAHHSPPPAWPGTAIPEPSDFKTWERPKPISILGSTGSIGTQTLNIVAEFPDRFKIVGLAAGSNVTLLADQVKTFKPQLVAIRDESKIDELKEALADAEYQSEIIPGAQGVIEQGRLRSREETARRRGTHSGVSLRSMENENENLHSFLTHSLSVKTKREMDAAIVEIPPPIHICKKQKKSKAAGSSSYLANFKQFDSVSDADASDHHFIGENFLMEQRSTDWAKEIEKEWKILEKDLPDSIFVRIYESRMDLLRAVIIGAEGTPYHDGLFFFDLCFPSGYPIAPPLVYFHSRGVLLNPNFFDSGTICLSLLATASGSGNELWRPRISTILQVLVSIQGLILNENPFFNGTRSWWERTAFNESASEGYNKETFIKSLWLMEQMIRRPPKNFEDFVVEHFISRAHDILVACNAYMEGAQVGHLVKGEVQDGDEGDKSCSEQCKDFPTGYMKVLATRCELFKNFLAGHVEVLVKEFARIGAKDCEKFLSSKANKSTFSLEAQFWDLAHQK